MAHYQIINDSETIYSESSQDPQDKLKHKIEAFQDDCILSFNEGNLHSCYSIFPLLEQALGRYCVDPLVSSDADR